MKKLFLFIYFFLAFIFFLSAQITESDRAKLKLHEDTLGVLSYAVVHDSAANYRFASCMKMIPVLVNALKIRNSFEYKFERMRTVSIQYPPDSSFRIFTWQLYVDDNDYRYYGAIQLNEPDLNLYPLVDRSHKVMDVENEILPPDRWYGSLYYNIKPFETGQGTSYLLFGYDAYSFFEKRKLVDVLTFVDGKPVLGAPVFEQYTPDSSRLIRRSRLMLQYGAQASVKLNYDEAMEMITYDNLIKQEVDKKQGPVNIPDGSYDGYQLGQDGKWHYVPKLFRQTQEEPPMDFNKTAEKTSSEKRDIFGRKKK